MANRGEYKMNKLQAIWYRFLSAKREIEIKKMGNAKIYSDSRKSYSGHEMMRTNQANQYIYDRIISGEPFFAGRFGATELLNMSRLETGRLIWQKYTREFHFNQLCEWSGFFPNDIGLLPRFVNELKAACKEVDFLAVWYNSYEDYYIKKLMSDNLKIAYLLDFEPWAADIHWSSALSGKKVLVIHPFEETIKMQYRSRSNIFPGTDILPEFELKTLKAVQTIAGEKDDRFETWFDALEWMYQEAMKIDFDVAIIGCGAYGFPLAAKLKKAGKQAIHLAGATQLLFGIRGKRWDTDPAFEYVRKWYNDAWVYPSEADKPKQAKRVEDGCYW